MRPLLALLLLAGCASGTAATPAEPLPGEQRAPGEPVTLRTGQSVRVGAPDELRVTFEAVEEDSRCPYAVVCVWAGDAVVRLRLAHAAGQEVHRLHTGVEPRQAAHAGYVVRLLRLAPERPSERTRPPYYEATLEISRP